MVHSGAMDGVIFIMKTRLATVSFNSSIVPSFIREVPARWNKELLLAKIKSFTDSVFPVMQSSPPSPNKMHIMLLLSNDKQSGAITKGTNENQLIYSVQYCLRQDGGVELRLSDWTCIAE